MVTVVDALLITIAKPQASFHGLLSTVWERNAVVEEIKALKELLDIGAITQEEFDKKKTELLAASNGAGASPKQAQSSAQIAQGEQAEASRAASKSHASKDKTAAGILAIFLGFFGVHKFYLGYTKEGAIMLLITIFSMGIAFPIVWAIAIIEGITYLRKTSEEFDSIYVQGHKGWF